MDLQAILERALALGEEGRWEELVALLSDALREEPEDPYLLGWLGVAEQELGNEGAAYDYFRRCIAEDPLDPNLLAIVGAGLAAYDDPDAEATLRAAALSGPEVTAARLQYGSYLARSGLFAEAMEHLLAARSLSPEDPMVLGELGVALALKGDRDAAIDVLESALDAAPEDEWTRVILGLLYLEADREEEGAEALVRAAEAAVEDLEAQVLAALASAAAGWEEAAYGALARAEQMADSAMDAALLAEVEDRVTSGAESARRFLSESLGPSALRERLHQPI